MDELQRQLQAQKGLMADAEGRLACVLGHQRQERLRHYSGLQVAGARRLCAYGAHQEKMWLHARTGVLVHQWRQEVLVLQQRRMEYRILMVVMGFHASPAVQVLAGQALSWWRFKLQKQKTGLRVLCAHATEPIQAVAWRVVACWRFRNATEGTLFATPKLEMPGLPSFGF